MGNCCSDVAGGRSAIGGTAGHHHNPADAPNDAVDKFLRSRGYHGLFSQIELSFSATGLRDRDVLSKCYFGFLRNNDEIVDKSRDTSLKSSHSDHVGWLCLVSSTNCRGMSFTPEDAFYPMWDTL
ncbi:protein BONZAI 1-like isoform X1 [Senna tora]|uniref:Protein BONZAI 1-like isoform X1 n=1 Tax=Senna tora TaxID=362788 RepID=A0A835C9D2_9FABA|nr:protein BONZAI 1-like isoform X1 [Senna tora]